MLSRIFMWTNPTLSFQLRKDVLEEHKASKWHEQIDPEYEIRIKRIAEGKVISKLILESCV